MKEQSCTVSSLYVSAVMGAILYPAVLAYLAYERRWPTFAAWLVLVPFSKWAYLRFFPRISKWKGYGSLEDKLPANAQKAPVEVTYYTLHGCPFCPVVSQRLEALQKEMSFGLTRIDLTLNPQLARAKGIRSVPVIEVGGDRLVGNATSEQLAKLIAHRQAA